MGRTAGIVNLLCLAGDQLLVTAIGLQGPFFTWAALHGHGDVENFNKLCLRGPLIQRHLDIAPNTGLAPNRDRNGQGCEQLDTAWYGPFLIRRLTSPQNAARDLRTESSQFGEHWIGVVDTLIGVGHGPSRFFNSLVWLCRCS